MDQPAPDQSRADQSGTDEASSAWATDQSGLPRDSPVSPAAALPTGLSEEAGPLSLVRIEAEPDHEAWPEDPWLPGSRRPDRRALIIGVVLIAGLLSVASTAWLVRVNPPLASSPRETHRSQPSQLAPGHAQPRQALSGQPTPILTQPSQPAPTQPAPTRTATGLARPGHTGQRHPGQSQPGQSQPGHNQSSTGHPGTSRGGTRSQLLWSRRAPARPGASHGLRPARRGPDGVRPGLEPERLRPEQAGSERLRPERLRPKRLRPGRLRPEQARPGRPGDGSGPSGTGHSGTGPGTTPTAPHPRWPAPGSRGGGARHPRPGVVSISAGLAGRADAQRVGGLLARYFAAVNHRRYLSYAQPLRPATPAHIRGILPGATGPAMTRTPYWSGSPRSAAG